jgi:hypothetical protein
MKKLTVLFMAVIAVTLLSLPAFAANQMDRNGMSSGTAAGGVITDRQLHGLNVVNQDGQVIGQIEAVNRDSNAGSKIISVTFKGLDESHYGLAPAWKNRDTNTEEMRLGNPSLSAIYDNVE